MVDISAAGCRFSLYSLYGVFSIQRHVCHPDRLKKFKRIDREKALQELLKQKDELSSDESIEKLARKSGMVKMEKGSCGYQSVNDVDPVNSKKRFHLAQSASWNFFIALILYCALS